MASSSEWTKHKLNEKDVLVPLQGTFLSLPRISVIYATILSLRKPLESTVEDSRRQFVLVPFHVGCFVKRFSYETSQYYSFTGESCVEKFLEQLGRIGENLLNRELVRFNKNSVPVVIHEFTKYASHFILKNLRKTDKLSQVIKKPEDKYFSFALDIDGRHKFRFFDPSTFLRQQLDELMETIDDRPHLVKYLAEDDQSKLTFVLNKTNSAVPFPFDFLDCAEKLEVGFQEMPRQFEDKLSAKDPEKEYEKAEKAWTAFGCTNLKEYSELHAKFLVLSLCDVFEKLRDLCRKKYKLEMLDFKTPGTLTWKAMLNHILAAEAEPVELLSDFRMIEFLKKNIRGGISQCCKRSATANNKFLEHHNADSSATFIIYLDMNNAAGYAMSQPLPTSDFSWMHKHGFNDKQAILNIPEKGEFGYIMEVDLHYPHHYGTDHRDLPYCCEKVSVNGQEKLITNLKCKKNYVIHYRNLQQCLKSGLELKRVHQVLKFKQAPWLASYIGYNTELRKTARTDLEKMFYKLMNNSLHGMTHQRIEEHFDLSAEEYGSNLTTEDCTLINKHCYLRKSEKKNVEYTELVHVGFCIHELIKLRMYDFHYKHMTKRYNGKLNLLYMETDSLIYEIKTEDFYGDLKSCADLLEEFDTSGLVSSKWEFGSDKNKKVVGKFKDEKDGKLIKEFFGTGSKTYYYQCEDGEEVKRLAGVPRHYIDSSVHREDYVGCVHENKKIKREFWNVKEDGTDLIMTRYKRAAFTPGDAKRKIVNQIETVPRGYKSGCSCDRKRKRSK